MKNKKSRLLRTVVANNGFSSAGGSGHGVVFNVETKVFDNAPPMSEFVVRLDGKSTRVKYRGQDYAKATEVYRRQCATRGY